MERFNPFVVSGYEGPEYFCDREKETGEIMQALRSGRNIVLMSPRRYGKTGLIRHVFDRVRSEEGDVFTFYFDIFPTTSSSEFIQAFGKAVLGKLDSKVEKAMETVRQFLKSCRPTLTFDEVKGTPAVMLDMVHADPMVTLSEIFRYLSSSGKRCYIAIDEFQQVASYGQKGFEAALRSEIQFIPNVNFIFSGSKLHLLTQMYLSAKRPFYQSSQLMGLSVLDKGAYYNFASKFFSKAGNDLPQNVFDDLYGRYDGVTWYIQAFLSRLYLLDRDVTWTDVLEVEERMVSDSLFAFEHLLGMYKPLYKRLLVAIAKEGKVEKVTSADFLSKYSLGAASSVSRAVGVLVEDETLYKSEGKYFVYDYLFSRYLERL